MHRPNVQQKGHSAERPHHSIRVTKSPGNMSFRGDGAFRSGCCLQAQIVLPQIVHPALEACSLLIRQQRPAFLLQELPILFAFCCFRACFLMNKRPVYPSCVMSRRTPPNRYGHGKSPETLNFRAFLNVFDSRSALAELRNAAYSFEAVLARPVAGSHGVYLLFRCPPDQFLQ